MPVLFPPSHPRRKLTWPTQLSCSSPTTSLLRSRTVPRKPRQCQLPAPAHDNHLQNHVDPLTACIHPSPRLFPPALVLSSVVSRPSLIVPVGGGECVGSSYLKLIFAERCGGFRSIVLSKRKGIRAGGLISGRRAIWRLSKPS
jgi:hypothetical protein